MLGLVPTWDIEAHDEAADSETVVPAKPPVKSQFVSPTEVDVERGEVGLLGRVRVEPGVVSAQLEAGLVERRRCA